MKHKLLILIMVLLLSGQLLAYPQTNDTQVTAQNNSTEKKLLQETGKLDIVPPVIIDEINKNTMESINIEQSPKIEYKDTEDTSWAYESLGELTNKYHILKGYPDGTYKGNKAASRYEMAQALAMLLETVQKEQIKLTAIEQAAIKSLKCEFEKEIITLAARVERNEVKLSDFELRYKADVSSLNSTVEEIKRRQHFVSEARFRYGFGDYAENDGTFANARLRISSNTKIHKDTFAVIRLQAETANLINMGEVNRDIADADLTLSYIRTGDLTSWIPHKLGKVDLYGGIMPTNWLFYVNGYTADVDQRGFSDANESFSIYNTMPLALARETTNGRRLTAGGEYYKCFSKYNGVIRASAVRATGGSIDIIGGHDFMATGIESTSVALMGQMNLPIKNLPTQLKVSSFYSINDAGTGEDTYSVGTRLNTKVNGVGVFKFAFIGYGGQVPPRIIGGIGGQGFTYQFAYNPTIKAFGKLFGDPDKISIDMQNYIPGKTEIGIAISSFENNNDIGLKVYDLVISRYIAENVFGRVLFTHVDPSIRGGSISARDSILLETIFRI